MIPEVPFSRGVISVGLVLLVASVFGQVAGHDFVDLDDGEYVYTNPAVLRGLSTETVAWAFTTSHAANWHPLTWLSHALDVTLFGSWPGGHHLTSVALHAANAVLLFLVLHGMTGAFWRSALVGALFAIHPLHVESVAWVAERKDVLSTLFGLLALGAYRRHVERPSAARWLGVLALYALSLLSKPMWVTLPFVLLLLDYWPLARRESPRTLVFEKLPLFALAALSSVATWLAQSGAGALANGLAYPLRERLLNAPIAVAQYLKQTLLPSGLAVFYPHPASVHQGVSMVQATAAVVVLLALTAACVWPERRRPYLAVGWLWFLGMLVPVLGLVQVGSQARADRYTYVPLIGVFIALAWLAGDLHAAWPRARPIVAAACAGIVVALALGAHAQTARWRSPETLYGHALAVTEGNWLAWNNLGMSRLERGELGGAMTAFESAARIKPDYADAWYNAGVALWRQGDHSRAGAAYTEALRLDPENADAWVNLGLTHQAFRQGAEAIRCFRRALEVRPADPIALEALRRLEER